MNTISTIVGPSITLVHPLVGSSLASNWVLIFEIEAAVRTMYGHSAKAWPSLSVVNILS